MNAMFEVRIHGRGGQGVKISASILGRAAFTAGFYTQDFALFGAERRGAPITSFCRISEEPIMMRGYIFEPDAVIVLDPTLDFAMLTAGIKAGSTIVVNAASELRKFKKLDARAVFVDATAVALDTVGKPVPNAAVLGAFAKLTGIVSLQNLEAAVRTELEENGYGAMADKNVEAVRRCYEAQ